MCGDAPGNWKIDFHSLHRSYSNLHCQNGPWNLSSKNYILDRQTVAREIVLDFKLYLERDQNAPVMADLKVRNIKVVALHPVCNF